MSLKTFEHVLILADDLKKTKEFYVDLLGLKDGYRPDFPFPGHWLYLNEDDKAACIHLAMRKQGDGQDYYIGKKNNVKSGSGAIDHVAFNCEDIDSMKEMFDNKSIEYTHRKVPGFPLEQLFVDDPDGVKVELNFPTKG
jgi:catechol 2,3-dioxygenase-like lactoylglutathione lyase family enzyme|tara:strand:- start:178 stop:594 length:417 start_codon:yes stop_codon:yes gene_type:complete